MNNPTPDAPGLQQFRKKPVVIEAVQFTREMAEGSVPLPIGVAMGSRSLGPDGRFPEYANDGVYLTNYSTQHRHFIVTLEGTMDVQIGDWIITGVKGEHYPCKPDIFAATYEPADTPPARPLPSDWVAVPREPTDAMQKAYFASIDKHIDRVQTSAFFGRFDNHKLAYRAMLTAAPSAPAEGGEDGPQHFDGHDHEGFPGGCERFGHSSKSCPAGKSVSERAEYSTGDAVFAFSAMLTSLPHVVPFGAAAWATPGADLAAAFNEANGLSVSRDFPHGLKFPEITGRLLDTVKKAADQDDGALEQALTQQRGEQLGDFQDKALAWDAVCDALGSVSPMWGRNGETGLLAAVNTIRSLATTTPQPGADAVREDGNG